MSHFRLATVIGHRGVPAAEPENSLAGLRRAAELGHSWCEIDTQASSDGVAFVHHDFRIASCGDRLLSKMDSAELSRVAVGTTSDGGAEMLPTLEDCLAVAEECGLGLVVEIKSRRFRYAADAEAAATALRNRPVSRLMVSSFSVRALGNFARLMPDVPIAQNVGRIGLSFMPGASNVHFDADKASRRGIARIVDSGLGAYAYTVNRRDRLEWLLSQGVHGVFTDTPDLLSAAAE